MQIPPRSPFAPWAKDAFENSSLKDLPLRKENKKGEGGKEEIEGCNVGSQSYSLLNFMLKPTENWQSFLGKFSKETACSNLATRVTMAIAVHCEI